MDIDMKDTDMVALVIRNDGTYDYRWGPATIRAAVPEYLRQVADQIEQGCDIPHD